jgi:Domain of unknown function DUF11
VLKRSTLTNVLAAMAAAGLAGVLAASVGASAARATAPAARGKGVDVWVTVGAATGTPGVVVGVPVAWGNHGPEAAGTVVLTYTPPTGTTLATPLPQGWTATVTGGATWTAAKLPAGGTGRSASLPVRISVKAEVGTLTGGRARIGLGVLQAHTDNAPGNDTAASTITVKPVPTPTPARPTPTRSAVSVPTTGGPTPPGPTPVGSDATEVAQPTPLAGAPDLDVVRAVLVPFGVVGLGCFLWMRRRLGD